MKITTQDSNVGHSLRLEQLVVGQVYSTLAPTASNKHLIASRLRLCVEICGIKQLVSLASGIGMLPCALRGVVYYPVNAEVTVSAK